jgi:transcriptional regulator with XRE-family HTH domain
MNLGNKVKIAMLQAGVKQVDIIQKFGFDKGDVSKVVHGKRTTSKIRHAIAALVGIPVDELFKVPEEPKNEEHTEQLHS